MRAALLLALMSVPSHAHARACPERPGDAVAIERTVRAFYDALGRDDRAAFGRQVTDDFIGFEYAESFTADGLFNLVANAHREGTTIVWGLSGMTVKVDCHMASAHWDNRGASGKAGAMTARRWRESAVLRRFPTGWRIELFHSTSAPSGK